MSLEPQNPQTVLSHTIDQANFTINITLDKSLLEKSFSSAFSLTGTLRDCAAVSHTLIFAITVNQDECTVSKVDFDPASLSINYLIHSGKRNQIIDFEVEPDCVNKAEILDQIKIISLDNYKLSNEQVFKAISLEKSDLTISRLERSDLILSVYTDDFVTYLGKTVTLEIGLENSEFAPK